MLRRYRTKFRMQWTKLDFLVVETTNMCNANPPCIYCFRRFGDLKPETMPLDLAKKIIDSCAGYARRFTPHMLGEPLLYPHIFEVLSYAKTKGMKTRMFTNASMLTKENSWKLLKTGINHVIFSVDADNLEDFEAIRRGLQWQMVYKNILVFQQLRNSLPRSKTKTTVRVCMIPENRDKIGGIKRFWKSKVDEVSVMPEINVAPPSTTRGFSSKQPVVCQSPFQTLCVKPNGNIILCYRDNNELYVYGNAYRDNPYEVFMGEEMSRVREAMKRGVGYPSLCDGCMSEKVVR